MTEDKNPPLESILMRIFDQKGQPVGAAVLIDDKHGVTCAHVVNEALGNPHEAQERPVEDIRIDFPLLEPGQKIAAEIVFWEPISQDGISANGGDIAGIRLRQPKPDAAMPARMVEQTDLWGIDFRTQGFPKCHGRGALSMGKILAGRADGYVQLEAAGEYKILPGFSGAPVWSEDARGVVGIMVVAETNRNIKAGWMIPTARLARAWDRISGEEQLPRPKEIAIPMVGRAVEPTSPFYIERDSDRTAGELIESETGVTLAIMGPHQIGKSSLLARLMARARSRGKKIAYVNFQAEFDQQDFRDADRFYRHFFRQIGDSLELEDSTEDPKIWSPKCANNANGGRYLRKHILAKIDAPLVLAMNEVSRCYDADFRSDFLGMLRSWHNDRAMKPELKRLDMVLVIATETNNALITDPNQSPFNIGETVRLRDFDRTQVGELNQLHGDCLTPKELEALQELVGGHPYLTRAALYHVATGRHSAADLFDKALRVDPEGPFAHHLRYYESELSRHEDIKQGMLQVIRHGTRPPQEIHYRLQALGLVHETGDGGAAPRNRLYADFFTQRLGP
ncbi:MAG: AAA-like domain-containing protein [Candidatus Thiosymbion ectosymbiont of Robbea hypermnestra]|nr:AAA-like domain-containing protein [Candidatus Thiosymbion ectosymbiont of Robbea hypermnestra]